MQSTKTAITPTRAQDYAEWYQSVIQAADLAEHSPVRGAMTIKPWGYAIWEHMQAYLDRRFKETGHKNAYFPLLIPLSFMQKEADHIEGFAKECAVVTHHRLAKDESGQLKPASPLEEAYIIRPTSETIIGEAFSRWIQSYRDLPLLINQWANVMRWEMRTRLFLRTSEFLWQEGHTAHATAEEALQETLTMLDVYAEFAENVMGMPVVKGEKSESERFPGADRTFCIEALMQDGKALQAGTSHFLGQHFSKSFNISFSNAKGEMEHAYTTSWGSSTRLMGGLIMTHSDDDGLVLPPRLAPLHVVILPVVHKEEQRAAILSYCQNIAAELRSKRFYDEPIRVEIDTRELTGGEKAWSWVKKGVPVRIEVGGKELDQQTVFMGRRDLGYKEKKAVPHLEFCDRITHVLQDIQDTLKARADARVSQHTHTFDTEAEFLQFFKEGKNGFVRAAWNGDPAIEERLKREFGITIRCLPLEYRDQRGTCLFTGDAGARVALFAKAY